VKPYIHDSIIMDIQETENPTMLHAHAIILGGALFKKKVKENGHDGDSKSREKAIRDKVVDDLRGREDSLREREAALAAREEEHAKKSSEVALKLQELAVRENELKGRHVEGGAPAKPAGHHELPPDSDKVEEQEKLVLALEHRLAGARARHDELRRTGSTRRLSDTIAAYRSSGYLVARLEKLHDLTAHELEKALGQFEKDAAALGPLAARCDALDRAVTKEAEALRARCNDPDAIADIERGIKELEGRLEARRAELRKRVDRWKNEGFSTARFAKLSDTGLGALEEAAAKFEEDIEVLRMFREKLGALDDSARKDADHLAPMLKDPDNIPALEKEFLELEKQAGIRRQAFLELFEKWKSEGFHVEPLEKALSAGLPAMRAAFLKFDEDVRRLRALSERASGLDASFAAQVAGLTHGLHDPEQLDRMETSVKELEEEAEKKKAASARRAHAPAPKVVSSRRTALAPKAEAVEKAPPAPAAPEEPAGDRTSPAVKSPAEEAAPRPPAPPPPPAPPTAAAEPAPPAGGPEAEVAAEMAAAEAIIKDLEAKKVDPSAAANLLKLGKSFNRSKNYAKALQYAKKAKDTAAAMRK
jgi:hypothetical protein